MTFSAKLLADSQGCQSRIVTMELTYPRAVHSEFLTHRSHARNAASSRAIPVEKMLANIRDNPFVPIDWGKNQSGMQAGEPIQDTSSAKRVWLEARDAAVLKAEELLGLGLHKQIVNRITEPWMWITIITTANEKGWENFFCLRCHKDAEPHMQKIAYMARDAYDASTPKILDIGEDHLPMTGFSGDEELSQSGLRKVATARCARVSYLTHFGTRDAEKDLELHDRLLTSKHLSPFEHVATNEEVSGRGGCLGDGWIQYRKRFAGECQTR